MVASLDSLRETLRKKTDAPGEKKDGKLAA
jgi:hypothetical protein